MVPCAARAADTLIAQSTVKEATIFFKGATITRSTTLSIPAGNSFILFSQLPYQIESHSIQVKAPKGIAIRSVQPEKLDVSDTRESDTEKHFEDQLDSIEVVITRFKKDLIVLKREQVVLKENQRIDSRQVSAESVKALTEFFHERHDAIESEMIDIELAIEEAQDHAKEIIEDINQEKLDRLKPSTNVLARVYSEKKQEVKIEVVYFTKSAGWNPTYDFEVKELDKPVTLRYKADLYQQTGENWDQVKLKLTTADPTHDARIPEQRTWYIQQGKPTPVVSTSTGEGSLKGKIVDAETGKPIPFVNVAVKQNEELVAGGATDFDGVFFIKPMNNGLYTVEASAIGLSPVRIENIAIKPDKITPLDIKMIENVVMLESFEVVEYNAPIYDKGQTSSGVTVITKDELVSMPARGVEPIEAGGNTVYKARSRVYSTAGGVYSGDDGSGDLTIRGSRSDANYVFIDGIKVRVSGNAPQTIQLNALADRANVNLLEYEIATPYSILSSPIETQLDLKEVEIPAAYKFHLYPSTDAYAHLVAHIGNWQSLRLFPGKAGIYYQNTYVGRTDVADFNAKDTLKLIISRDYDIMVRKTQIKDYTQKINYSNSSKQYVGWKFELVNKKDKEVIVVVHDQLPTSNSKDIRIEVEELSGATVDKHFYTRWDRKLAPLGTDSFELKYYIKHPKYVSLGL